MAPLVKCLILPPINVVVHPVDSITKRSDDNVSYKGTVGVWVFVIFLGLALAAFLTWYYHRRHIANDHNNNDQIPLQPLDPATRSAEESIHVAEARIVARNNLRAHRAQQAALVSERNALRDADRNPDADEIRFFSNRTEPVTASDTVDWAHAAERAHARRVATAVTAITNVSAVYLDNVESRAVTIRQIEAEIDATTAANAAAEHTEPVTAAPINTNETHGAQIGVNHAAPLSQTYAGHQAAVAVTGITAPASSSHTPVEQEQTQVVDFAAPSSERTLVDVATPSSSQTSSARTSVDDYFDLPSDDDAAEDEGEPLTEQDRRIMARSFAIQAAERMQERANFAILRDWRPLTEDEFEE